MNESRLDRLAPLTGLVAILLLLAGTVLIGLYDYLPPADNIANYLSTNPGRAAIGGYLGVVSAFFLIWFAGSVRAALREREGGNGWVSEAAFGGGIAGAVIAILLFTSIGSAALRAGAEGGITPIGAITLYDFWSQLGGLAYPVTMAVFIGATAVVSLRTSMFPNWFGWVSVLVALGLLSPISYIVISLGMIWVLAVSIWLYAKGGSAVQRSAAAIDRRMT
jgi:hypothetical protein